MNQHFNKWHWTKALLVFLLALTASLLCSAAQASLVIVSDRSSSVLVAGAHRYLDKKPQADIAIRTVSQVERLNDADLQQLLLSHHSLLLAGVFGESVERLLAMAYPRGQRRFVLHSDNRLMALQRDANGQPFSSAVSQQFVGSEGLALDAESLAASQQKFPEYSAWLQARAYWIHRSAVNAESLIAL
ncbi:MAG: cobaltochelatase subunit CobN, partial [Spongiibacter marinus]